MSELEVQASPATELSAVQRITSIFTAPSKVFGEIKAGRTSWWLPLVVLSLVAYLFLAAVQLKIGFQQVAENAIHFDTKAEARLATAPPEAREQAVKISTITTQVIMAASPVFLLIVALVVSGVLLATINFVFGGKAKFKQMYSVWFYANLPSLIKTLLGVVVIFAGTAPDSFNIKNFAPTNVAAFLNPLETHPALYALLTSLDVITIWSLALMSIGFATVAGVKRSSGYIAVFGWWAIVVLASVVPTLF